ncbi:MAG: hypothetical protein IPO88_17160 [Nannocystis sp.]|uniref:dickkopf-related protein n=1 Tax=Nannocystis sp. TaxID=1962667 RepID=UPI0024242168|nr:dickkopf-related protein [Nannocystis sp.]MBK9755194.1 hypothetical protein [Nannocystis sp.]
MTHRVPAGRARLAGLAGLAGLLTGLAAACSTLAEVEQETKCVSDDECNAKVPGQVCGEGICYDASLPDRAAIGLDVLGSGLESNFRVELRGTDAAALRIDRTPVRYSVSLDDRKLGNNKIVSGVRDQLEISLSETYNSGDSDKTTSLAGSLTLTQASRLGREVVTKNLLRVDLIDPMTMQAIADPKVVLPWARYDRDKAGMDIPLLLAISADDGLDEDTSVQVYRGLIYRQLVRPQLPGVGTHAFTMESRRECHRKIYGTLLLTDKSVPTSPADISFRHARRDPEAGAICDPAPETGTPAVCSPQTVAALDSLPECITVNDCPPPYGCHSSGDSKRCGCDRDDECPLGQVCELTSKRCALDLGDLVATKGVVSTVGAMNQYEAWIYTYCEGKLEADREMEFVVSVAPRNVEGMGPAPLPELSYHTTIDFLWSNGMRPPEEADRICLPTWAPPQSLAFQLSSAPQQLYTDAKGQPWVCCSPACLDTSDTTGPATVPTSCPLGATVTARTVFTPDPVAWSNTFCMELERNDLTLPAGSQRVTYGPLDRSACAQPDTPCEISLSRGDGELEYEIRVEPPVGSLVRSTILPPQIVAAGTASVTPAQLEYRVLVHGQVKLPGGEEDCTDILTCLPNAEIMAERLRIADDDPATTLGPYFYTAQTIPGSPGDFVLAVNPGVYLITALPQSGSQGGPARIAVHDLRLDSPAVDTKGPMPTAELTPIELELGKLVTIELDNFDRSSVAVPLDMAGWKGQIAGYPDLDLNDPSTCYGGSGRGCLIRRLRPGKSGLSPTQEQFVKYLTRAPK